MARRTTDEGDTGFLLAHSLNWSYTFAVPTKEIFLSVPNARNFAHLGSHVKMMTWIAEAFCISIATSFTNELLTNAPNVMLIGQHLGPFASLGRPLFQTTLTTLEGGRKEKPTSMRTTTILLKWWLNPLLNPHPPPPEKAS